MVDRNRAKPSNLEIVMLFGISHWFEQRVSATIRISDGKSFAHVKKFFFASTVRPSNINRSISSGCGAIGSTL
jgi:hypothetical protein